MNLAEFDDAPGRVVKLTGPRSVSSPGPGPVFAVVPTAWSVTCRLADPFTGRLCTRVVGRVWLNGAGLFAGRLEGDSELREHSTSKGAVAAVKREFKRRGGW